MHCYLSSYRSKRAEEHCDALLPHWRLNLLKVPLIQFKPSHWVIKLQRCSIRSSAGFGLFGNYKLNPSWEAVSQLKQPDNVTLIKQQIEVVYDAIDRQIPEIWQQHKPSVITNLVSLRFITLAVPFTEHFLVKDTDPANDGQRSSATNWSEH